MVRYRGVVAAFCVATGLVVLGAGCSSSSRPTGALVDVRERDFKLTATADRVRAGWVTFHVHNFGPSTHEFNLDRTAAAADALPLEANGLQANEGSALLHRAASIGDVRMGSSQGVTVRLAPGHYVMYCNLEGHYLGGMSVALDVTA